MQVTVVTDVNVEGLIPPRCRKPRSGSVSFEVVCELEEIRTDAIILAAHTTTREFGDQAERDYHFEPSVGFLIQDRVDAVGLARAIGHHGYWPAVPAEEVPGQGEREIAQRSREIRERVAENVASDNGTVYRKVAEPCYRVKYSPSFNWSSCDLAVREAPAFTPVRFHHERGWNRFFNAMALREATRLKDALWKAMHDRVTGHEDRIDVFFAEAFTFEADRWHAEREIYLAKEKFDELVRDMERIPSFEDTAFCAEQHILAELLRNAGGFLQEEFTTNRLRMQAADRYYEWIESVEEENDGDVVPAV